MKCIFTTFGINQHILLTQYISTGVLILCTYHPYLGTELPDLLVPHCPETDEKKNRETSPKSCFPKPPAVFKGLCPSNIKTHEDHIGATVGKPKKGSTQVDLRSPSILVVVSKCVPQSQTDVHTIHRQPGVLQNLQKATLFNSHNRYIWSFLPFVFSLILPLCISCTGRWPKLWAHVSSAIVRGTPGRSQYRNIWYKWDTWPISDNLFLDFSINSLVCSH